MSKLQETGKLGGGGDGQGDSGKGTLFWKPVKLDRMGNSLLETGSSPMSDTTKAPFQVPN